MNVRGVGYRLRGSADRGAVIALAVAGWSIAALLTLRLVALRRRLELVARAEHELRGPATALLLSAERMQRDPRARPAAQALLVQLERLRTGLADLGSARAGRLAAAHADARSILRLLAAQAVAGARPLAAAAGRRVRFDWRGRAPRVWADRGRLAQVLANLTANAVEHGEGTVEVRGREADGRLRIEVRDEGAPRGRGIAIAADAAREAGGELSFVVAPEGTRAVLELPLEDGPLRRRERAGPAPARPAPAVAVAGLRRAGRLRGRPQGRRGRGAGGPARPRGGGPPGPGGAAGRSIRSGSTAWCGSATCPRASPRGTASRTRARPRVWCRRCRSPRAAS